MIVCRSLTMHLQSPFNYWRDCAESADHVMFGVTFDSTMTTTFARFQFPRQLLRDFVSWGSNAEYSMIDCFLGDAFGGLYCPFWSTFCSMVLGCRYTTSATGPCSQCQQFVICRCGLSDIHILNLWQYYVCYARSGVIWGAPTLWCYTWAICGGAGYTCAVFWSHAGMLMRLLAAEPRSSAGLLFLFQCLCETIMLTQYSMV